MRTSRASSFAAGLILGLVTGGLANSPRSLLQLTALGLLAAMATALYVQRRALVLANRDLGILQYHIGDLRSRLDRIDPAKAEKPEPPANNVIKQGDPTARPKRSAKILNIASRLVHAVVIAVLVA